MAKGSGKSQVGALLLLLGVLAGYGAWNYQRNVDAEAKLVRPYRTYSDEQLAQLAEAYEQQAGELSERYEARAKRRRDSRSVGAVGEGVDQFAAISAASRRTRELGAQLSQEEASLAAIRAEETYRASLGTGAMAFLRRAFVPPAS